MHNPFNVTDLLRDIAPGGICADCVRDRMPLNQRNYIETALSGFSQSAGECVGCQQQTQVVRLGDHR